MFESMDLRYRTAPEWNVKEWLNTPHPITLESLKGKIVVLHAFQMLCPGCVSHGIPQAKKIYETFDATKVVVIGLHTVFEHHEAMTPVTLKAFVHENKLKFPIGIDANRDGQGIPKTMEDYGMQGTPTLILIDGEGKIRLHVFGAIDDLVLGTHIGQLLEENKKARL